MSRFSKLSEKLAGLTAAVTRYPAATAFLLLATGLNTYALITDHTYGKAWRACVVGAAAAAVAQAVYERFFQKSSVRAALAALGAALAGLFYLLIRAESAYSTQNDLRTGAILFALMFAFILVPAVKSRVSFNESFMAAFKALFQSLLYAAVFFLGCSLIIAAFDALIAPIPSESYLHVANVVFVLLAPVFYLSLIPVYPGRLFPDGPADGPETEKLGRATHCPKFLEVLIAYIIIPLAEIFTVILVLYIVLNIGGDFWRNNLLEPLLISYAITVILILFLSARLLNRMAVWFCRIFPKVLVPIVLFQLVASTLILRDTGVTHSRYFVILFGIFAICAGVLLGIAPMRKSGIAAALLVVFSLVSITPPVDAFTVSRASQRQRLEAVLSKNDMLQNDRLIPAADLPLADREAIVSSLDYLHWMDGLDRLAWLPPEFDYYADFESAFGFARYGGIPDKEDRYINVFIAPDAPINVDGYAVLARASVNLGRTGSETICTMEQGGRRYTLTKADGDRFAVLALTDSDNNELIRFDTGEIFSRYSDYGSERAQLTAGQATFSAENDRARLAVTVQNASFNRSSEYYYADFYVLLNIK